MRKKLPILGVLALVALSVPQLAHAAKSRVRFLSNPPGATVVDANLGELGTTPLQLDLKRNTVLDCTFSRRGYESRSVTRTLDALHVVVQADLEQLPMTSVRLGVKPANASVRLTTTHGVEIYSGPANHVHALPPAFWGANETARFNLEAWAPGYRRLEEEIELTNHERHDLEFTLNEVSTLLSLTSDLEGVRVSSTSLGGSLGSTPLERRVSLVELLRARSRQQVSQGHPSHVVLTFSKPGYRTQATQIELDFERAENTFEVTLEPLDPS